MNNYIQKSTGIQRILKLFYRLLLIWMLIFVPILLYQVGYLPNTAPIYYSVLALIFFSIIEYHIWREETKNASP